MNSEIDVKIPESFVLFSTKINVTWDNARMNNEGKYGCSEYSHSRIVLSTTHGHEPLSSDRIIDCFYHEKVHMILNTMNRDDLSSNEQFVDILAKLWRQSDETAKFKTLCGISSEK